MLLMLQRRGRLTARQLATELEVSPRTVLRDVNALSGAGVPIFTVQGVRGGIELTSGFRTDLTGVTTTEAAALLLAGQPMIAECLGLAADAAAVRRKLIEALPAELRDVAEQLDRWFLHEPDAWDGDRVPLQALPRLTEAIQSRVTVELTFSTSAARLVQPLGLVLRAGEWHIVMRAGNRITARRLHDLEAVRITRRRFEPPDGFDVKTFWSDHAPQHPPVAARAQAR